MTALAPLDELFLAQDGGVTVGHSGALVLFDAAQADAELTAADLRRLVEERLEHLPLLRRRPEPDPGRQGHHRWVEADVLDLDAHVAEHDAAVTDDRALGRLAARLNARPLDRTRPLWELHVLGGLPRGRVGALLKIHHALGDAAPVRHVLGTLFGAADDRVPAARDEDADEPEPPAADSPETAAPRGLDAPVTRFNRPLSAERDFAFASIDRERVDRARRAAGTTFHDVVLAAWAGALRGWLSMRGETPAEPLVARVPISLRRSDDAAARGNQLAVVRVPLATHLGDARLRLRAAQEAMTVAKRANRVGARAPAGGRGPAVNLALSTLFGSQGDLAWRGAPRLGTYALAMVNAAGLAIACMTYPRDVCVGVHVDAEQADPWALVRAFDVALADVEATVAG